VADVRIVPDRIADPVAMPMLREDERDAVRRVREQPARDWPQRFEYETLRASAEVFEVDQPASQRDGS
jgi:hypothetical protein